MNFFSKKQEKLLSLIIILIPLIILPLIWGIRTKLEIGHSHAQALLTQVRSTTYYEINSDASGPQLLADLTKDLPLIKAAGFNTIWLVGTWQSFEPIALPGPTYNDAAFQNLNAILALLKTNNMHAILPLNYLGKTWAPQGIDPCQWSSNITMYNAFEAYATEYLNRISSYSDITYIMVFDENADLCGINSGSTQQYQTEAKILSQTLGNFPNQLPSTLRAKFLIGFHDGSLIALLFRNFSNQ